MSLNSRAERDLSHFAEHVSSKKLWKVAKKVADGRRDEDKGGNQAKTKTRFKYPNLKIRTGKWRDYHIYIDFTNELRTKLLNEGICIVNEY